MKTTASNSSLSPVSLTGSATSTVSYPWLMLISRSVLFIIFQVLIALVLAAAGTEPAWIESARWWTFLAILANIVTIYLLVRVFNAEANGI